MGHNADTDTVLVREGSYGSVHWRQYIAIGDGCVAIVHMIPALLGGWRFDRVDCQGASDWGTMSRDSILAWKMAQDDGRTERATLDAGFCARMFAKIAECAS